MPSRLIALARSPEGTIAIYAIVAIAATVAAYFYLFTQFAPYDDEGTVLVTLKAFVGGETLYRDVYTPFGPFYYELFGSLFSVSGHAVTTDASRSIVMVIWVGASLLFGLAVQRLTGRVALGVTAMLVAFTVVFILSQEPMHAQVLAIALLAVFTAIVSGVDPRRVALTGGICGALLAALVLTKINLGIYAVAAVFFASVLVIEPLHRRRWVRWPVIAAFLALPFVVTGHDLSNELVRNLALLELLAATSIAVASWSLRLQAVEEADQARTARWLLGAVTGFCLAFAAILAAIFITGSTPADVYDGVVTQALRIRTVNPAPIGISMASLDWGIAAIAAAAGLSWLRSRGDAGSLLWSGVLRAAAGLAIWFSITQSAPLSLGPAPGNVDALAMVLAWVAVIPPAGAVESAQRRFVRVLLPILAVAEVLQVYPVAGSQMRIAAVMFVAVGGICLGDAFTELRAWSAARGPVSLERLGVIASIAIVTLGAKFALDGVVLPAVTRAITYSEEKALPFPGATSLHLPTAEAEAYERVVELLHRYRCTTFIGYANVDSLYLWSQIDPPKPSAPSAWMLALDEGEQRRILREMRATPRPCAVRNEGVAGGWLAGRPRPETPLMRYVFNDFKVVETTGPFEFMLPKGGF
ncbi:MAG TPA: hypothetical protein VIM28_10640 [Solirubrobacterales bacterium]